MLTRSVLRSPATRPTRAGAAVARALLAVLVSSGLAAAQAQERERMVLTIDVRAGADANPDAAGRASPIKVRVYELKDGQAFTEGDYFSLDEKDKVVLANDLLARDEMILRPGESRRIERKTHPGTQYIGVLAGYRDLAQSRWRVLHRVPEAPETAWYRAVVPAAKVQLTIELQAMGVVLTAAP